MIDSLITELPGYSEGWLLALKTMQYVGLVLLLAGLAIGWWFTRTGQISQNATEVKQLVLMVVLWLVRVILIMAFLFLTLSLLGLNVNEFLGTPVVIIAGEVPVSPFLVLTLIIGSYLLIVFNKLIKKLVVSASKKWNFHRDIALQIRRFSMLLLFLIIGHLWLKLAGSYLIGFFGDKLFEVSEVSITPGILLYFLLLLYGFSIGIRLIEMIYTSRIVSKGLNIGQSKTVFQLLKYALWVIAIILLLNSIGLDITVLVAGSAALLVGLGFGIQGLFNDYISGLVVLFEGLIKVGDVVEIESEFIGRVNFENTNEGQYYYDRP